MGVVKLWPILDAVKERRTLSSLEGETLAVDLSIWIVSSHKLNTAKSGIITKPHIRNLFFRVSCFIRHGIKLIFVLDGRAPDVKRDAMKQRHLAGAGDGGYRSYCSVDQDRTTFNNKVVECCTLLDLLGVPYIRARGEAEAMCAELNKRKVVDACLTEDGDVFLYGATKVYRNFSMDDKELESYSKSDLETQLHLSQEKLVALALLLGCDYTSGVHGVGAKAAMDLVNTLHQQETPGSILERMKEWRTDDFFKQLKEYQAEKKTVHCTLCSHPGKKAVHKRSGCAVCSVDQGCVEGSGPPCPCSWHAHQGALIANKVELAIQQKAVSVADFPQQKVINEYLNSQETIPSIRPRRRADPFQLMDFLTEELGWMWSRNFESKVLPLLTAWEIRNEEEKEDYTGKLTPICVMKTKILKRVELYEVQWHKLRDDRRTWGDFYTTDEQRGIFKTKYPGLVEDFEKEEEAKRQAKVKSSASRGGHSKNSKRQRGGEDQSQTKITDMFKVTKKSYSDAGEKMETTAS